MAKRIIVVGSGFAGMWSALSAARALHHGGNANGAIEIVLIAPEPALHVRPRFYEPNPAAMKAPLGAVFDAVGIRYAQGTVERIRTDDDEVEASRPDGSRFTKAYDRLVLAAGSKLFRPAFPDFASTVSASTSSRRPPSSNPISRPWRLFPTRRLATRW
jgi:NADH:ubiquinone reductase (H+-translocating)